MAKRRKRIRRALRVPFEWLGIGLGVVVISSLPRRAMLAVCDFIGAAMYVFDRRGRRIAHQNLAIVFSTMPGAALSDRAERAIVRRSYRNMARAVGHAFWTCRKARERAAEAGELSPECREAGGRGRA